jgi:exonuclease VII large subunit
LDQTVYHSAKTPTDAAYYLIEHAQSIEVMLDELYQETIMGVTSWYETTVQKIETIYEEIESLFETVLIEKSQNLEQLLVDITAYDPNIQLQK